MNLKFLIQPLIEVLREEYIAEGQQRQAASPRLGWRRQEKAGKITIHEQLEVLYSTRRTGSNGHANED